MASPDAHGDAVALRRRGRADRRRAQARCDDQARRRRGRRAHVFEDAESDLVPAPAGRHDHGPRRPRNVAADSTRSARPPCRHRGGRDHAAHRRVPGRAQGSAASRSSTRPARSIHRDACARREGHRHRGARRRGKRQRDAADPQSISSRARRGASRSSSHEQRSTSPTRTPTRCARTSQPNNCKPEEWGGTTQFAEVSAKTRQGLDELLEKVLLVADVELEQLKANPNAEASARSSSPASTRAAARSRRCSCTAARSRSATRSSPGTRGRAFARLNDFRGEKLKEATPGTPVEILGFDKTPPAGETARVVESERQAAASAHTRGERLRREVLAQRSNGRRLARVAVRADARGRGAGAQPDPQGDVVGSVEAAVSELKKIKHSEVRVNVIHQGVGGITRTT